ncbi:MAG: hypothetical protein LBQ61_08995, partial [Spirochaetales bacterium]|nr:hypothetical protein [Spirochaetales bacterium]
TVSRDEIERARLSSEYEGMLDRQAELTDARDEGRNIGLAVGMAKGLAEGRAEAAEKAHQEKIESARRLKSLGVLPDKIALGLGLAQEEIEKL